MFHNEKLMFDTCVFGDYELAESLLKKGVIADWGLAGACKGGHSDIAQKMIDKGAYNWDFGFGCACRGGHRDLVQMMIDKGASVWSARGTTYVIDIWNMGLGYACLGGHHDLVQMMIDRGANHWNRGLEYACRGGHHELVQMMINRGATLWYWGLRGACLGGHRDFVQMMIDWGRTIQTHENDWELKFSLECACEGGHRDLVQMMIDRGANDWESGLCSACEGGHRDIAQMMMDLQRRTSNSDNKRLANWGLYRACRGCFTQAEPVGRGGHLDIVQMMINYGANDWNSIFDHFKTHKKFIASLLFRLRGKQLRDFQSTLKVKVPNETIMYLIDRHAIKNTYEKDDTQLLMLHNIGQYFCKDLDKFVARFRGSHYSQRQFDKGTKFLAIVYDIT